MDRPAPKGAQTLVSQISDALRQAILAGDYAPGDRLPSEARLTEAHQVSRTVVREALATLRSDGLIEARQGSGVYVLESEATQPTRHINGAALSSVLEMLEIRAPVEAQAARLAAQRRSPAQEELLFERHLALIAGVRGGGPIQELDFALHQAIAMATNNPQFRNFLDSWGPSAVPNSSILTAGSPKTRESYHNQLIAEHEEIVVAISRRDEEGAGEAMRRHLEISQRRHRDLMQSIRLGHAPARRPEESAD